jgi:HK97 gp10 family phage protein
MRMGRIRKQAVAALNRIPGVQSQVRKASREILKEARRLAPVDTGTLRRSLMVEEVRGDNGEIGFRVGWDRTIAPYGPLVELGTEDTAAQPHLRPAANKVKGR